LGVLVWLVMRRTQIGVVARAVIMNEELAQSLGINTRLVRFVTFCLGAGLASLAGALITPLVSVHPNLGCLGSSMPSCWSLWQVSRSGILHSPRSSLVALRYWSAPTEIPCSGASQS
jgi:hypothetical protein